MHCQSILHAVKKHEFKTEFGGVYVLFPWLSPINVIALKVRDQGAMTSGFDVGDNPRNQMIVRELARGQI